MGWFIIVLAVLVVAAIMFGATKLPALGRVAAILSLMVLLLGLVLSSVRYVGENELGVVVKKAFGGALPQGKIIATSGEMGPQAEILSPGWHFGYWPGFYEVETSPVLEIKAGEVGLVETSDGDPLPPGEIYAPEWTPATFQQMQDATYFLSAGKGYKGPQASVLTPGKYRLNPKLYRITMAKVTNIPVANVGVVKANVGSLPAAPPVPAPDDKAAPTRLVNKGERGIWKTHLEPQEYYLHTNAYEITMISTKANVVNFTKAAGGVGTGQGGTTSNSMGVLSQADERAITVRSSDGFTFPVDVRVEYQVEPANAPLLVSTLRDDKDSLHNVLSSAVRAIFRNSAESVRALDYVQQRSHQETQALEALKKEMVKYGVTINAVRIGDVGDEQSLGTLLKTQTDREIAKQEQLTFQEQQRSAEQKKALTRTTQESEEEKRLATAKYEVKIADETKARRITEAGAEAEAIRIKAEAQAKAFDAIARSIGPSNAAALEMLKTVGERNITITPRVFIGGGGAGGGGGVALVGTMLDYLTSRDDPAAPARPEAPATPVRPPSKP